MPLPVLSKHRGDRSIAGIRLRNQRLVGAPFTSPADVVDELVCVQSQDYPGACWGVAQRCGATRAEIHAAFDRGDLLRTHVLRPTWHFVRPADLHWLLALTGPRVLAASQSYHRSAGVDAATLVKSDAAIAKRLASGPATRAEVVDALVRAGVADPSGLRLASVLMHAELTGIAVSGPRRAKPSGAMEQTWALADTRAPRPPPIDRRDAITRLAARYFTAHGPATVHDFAWWSGLSVGDARLGVESLGAGFYAIATAERTYHAAIATTLPPPPPIEPLAHLLPNYDELLIAYKDHSVAYDPALASASVRGVPFSAHSVTMNGLVIGAWKRAKAGIELELWVQLARDGRRALADAVQRAEAHAS